MLNGGPSVAVVGQTQKDTVVHLKSLGCQILVEKTILPYSKAKFLGSWWRERRVCIPPETLITLEQGKVQCAKPFSWRTVRYHTQCYSYNQESAGKDEGNIRTERRPLQGHVAKGLV